MHQVSSIPNDQCKRPALALSVRPASAVQYESANEFGDLLEGCRQYLLVIAEDELGDDLLAKAGASDLVQETFLEAQKAVGQFHGASRDEMLAWLRQILLYRVAKLGRRYRRTRKRELSREWQPLDNSEALFDQLYDSEATSPSGLVARTEQTALVQQALDRLPADYRTVVLLRHRDHLKFAEIAAQLERSTDAVRMLWYRAINCLAKELEPHGE